MTKKEDKKDWRIIEFCMPIKETSSVKDDFFIRGMAINETTTRNGITYIASELEKAAPSFRGKPVLTDHENSVRNIVGRTTENVNFNSVKKGIEFEAKIMDKDIQEMITDGRITDVSIGAKVEDLIENEEDKTITAVGIEGLEVSLVAVPGDPGANIANAISESLGIRKEILMAGKEPEDYLNDKKEVNDMAEEGEETKEQPEESSEEAETEETPENGESEEEATEEKLKKVQAELAKYKKAEERAKLKTELKKEIMAEIKEQEEITPPAEDEGKPAEEEKPEPKDETKGEVGSDNSEEEVTEENFVIERADVGKGFQIWRDYSKDTDRFKRLSR